MKATDHSKTSSENMDYLSSASAATWILVADTEGIKVLEKTGIKFHLVNQFPKPDLAISGMDNDTLGRGGAYGAGRHKYEPSMEASRQERTELARRLAEWLDKKLALNEFSRLGIVAAPQMLGEIRNALGDQVAGRIYAEVDKEFLGSGVQGLHDHLNRVLPGPGRSTTLS